MKILIPSSLNVVVPDPETESGNKILVSSKELRLSETGQGKHVGLLPIQFNLESGIPGGETLTQEKLIRVEVAAEASDNNRGARRVMLKVSLPYSRISVNADGSRVIDAASSGAITAHVVLSVPSRCRTDLLEQNDPYVAAMASAHVALALNLMRSLTQGLGSAADQVTITSHGADEALVPVEPAAGDTIQVDQATQAVHKEVLAEYFRLTGGSGSVRRLAAYSSQTFGMDGLSVTTTGRGESSLTAAARDPLVRGLYGLVPIEENSTLFRESTVRVLDHSGE